jgi:hypothetical protein
MKYFLEIENWQKYFGCIFRGKQGSNASTTSMYPTPLVERLLLWTGVLSFNKEYNIVGCNAV